MAVSSQTVRSQLCETRFSFGWFGDQPGAISPGRRCLTNEQPRRFPEHWRYGLVRFRGHRQRHFAPAVSDAKGAVWQPFTAWP